MQVNTINKKFDKTAFVQAALSYIKLLRNHIEKENNILFPMGDARLSASIQEELLAQFEIYEENVIGEGKHEELHALLEKFKEKYLS
jgi:hemerythrin-like domain-containing protein